MSWGDGSGVPTSGSDIVIVGVDNNGLLHIRIFDASGKEVTDTDETKLPATRAGAISALKRQIPGLLPPHVLTAAERAKVVRNATSIVGQTPRESAADYEDQPLTEPSRTLAWVYCGGGWRFSPGFWSWDNRVKEPGFRNLDLGFRLALEESRH
jgi:hypothetical protein